MIIEINDFKTDEEKNNFLDSLTLKDIKYKELNFSLRCCNKEMIDLKVVDYMNNNTLEIVRFICSECGTFKDVHTYGLNDEELLNEIELYKELQNTKIIPLENVD